MLHGLYRVIGFCRVLCGLAWASNAAATAFVRVMLEGIGFRMQSLGVSGRVL